MTADETPATAFDECPDEEALRGFALGSLSDNEMVRIAAHLPACATCEATLLALDPTSDSFVEYLRDYDESLCLERGFELLGERLADLEVGSDSDPNPPRSSSAKGLPAASAPPAQLGNYELFEELGRGAMGVVYRARHTKLNRVVAVKLLGPLRTDDPESVARFAHEMEALGKLDDHPHVIRARDAGESDGRHYLVMDLVDGIDLGSLVRRTGPLRVVDACEIVRQAALGLAHAHGHGLLHRDVKPSNLMLTRRGNVQLLDLGLAAARVPGGAENAVVGTADYMAPEQWVDSARLDVGVDIYGLGCTFYKLLVGHAPFALSTVSIRAKRNAHTKAPPASLGSHRQDVPEEVDDLITRMLAKRATERPRAADAVAASLAGAAAGADLVSLASSAVGDEEDTAKHYHDPTFAERVLGPLSMAVTTRRRWIATGLGVAGLGAAFYWLAHEYSKAAPFEVLIAAEPKYVKWEYNALEDSLQSHSTGEVLFRIREKALPTYRLVTSIERLDQGVAAGVFFGYSESTKRNTTTRRFEVVGTRSGSEPRAVEVFRMAYIVTTEAEREIWESQPIAAASVVPKSEYPFRKLGINGRGAELVDVTIDGEQVEQLFGTSLSSTMGDGVSPMCGVFSTQGAASFARTRLTAV